MLKVFCGLALFFTVSSVVQAQTVQEQPVATLTRERVAQQKNFERLKGGRTPPPRIASINMMPLIFGQRISKEQKNRLAPTASDLNRHAEFLRKPRTGLIKLFPDVGCEDNSNIVRADETCLQWIPNSGFYSFREREHTSDFLADIRLKDNSLISDGILSQSILVNLGDVDLEGVTSLSGGLKFLNEFEPAAESKAALKQVEQLIGGVKTDDYVYKRSLPAVENSTYALRVVAYRGSLLTAFRGRLFNVLEGDKRIDATIIFRVLGKNSDGSLNLLWRELSRKDAPKVQFPKRGKK